MRCNCVQHFKIALAVFFFIFGYYLVIIGTLTRQYNQEYDDGIETTGKVTNVKTVSRVGGMVRDTERKCLTLPSGLMMEKNSRSEPDARRTWATWSAYPTGHLILMELELSTARISGSILSESAQFLLHCHALCSHMSMRCVRP